MFEDSFFILKNDYRHRRKPLLLFLLQREFQIQGSRRVSFSPELAAEFYEDKSQDADFMLSVILLSKGPSEAFIVAKQNAVEDLLNTMVCYFGSSPEMNRYIYVTPCAGKVKHDITFIFPNYIPEPITCPKPHNICCNRPFVTSLLHTVYDVVTKPEIDPHKSLCIKLAEWCTESNRNLPNVSNQCSYMPSLNLHEMAQQTRITSFKHEPVQPTSAAAGLRPMPTKGSSSYGTSSIDSSSSCVSCSKFNSSCECIAQNQRTPMDKIFKAKTAQINIIESLSSLNICEQLRKAEEREKAGDALQGKGSIPKISKTLNTGAGDAPPTVTEVKSKGIILDSSFHTLPSKGKVASVPSLPPKGKTVSPENLSPKGTITSAMSVPRIPSHAVTVSAVSVQQHVSAAKLLASASVTVQPSQGQMESGPKLPSQSATILAVNVPQHVSMTKVLSPSNVPALPSKGSIASAVSVPQQQSAIVNETQDVAQGPALDGQEDE